MNDKNCTITGLELDKLLQMFHDGNLYDAYRVLGCMFDAEKKRAVFRVFAPRASFVSVVGNFNDWNEQASPMTRITEGGVWEVYIENITNFDSYKYYIKNGDRVFYKSDPYARHSETRELTNSKVYNIAELCWSDNAYLEKRSKADVYHSPINIYEAHIGSWRKNSDGSYYTYRQFADEIVGYLKKLNYTHLELMGIAEYPYDNSWGYQVTGYFAPTSRYGTPADFAYLVNKLHCNGIGVIIDWVPGHFPKNDNGLYEFDGLPLYEPSDHFRMEHKDWGTRCFDYARNEVRSFLISNAMMWLNEYHIDGIRVDAVASILYLDYGRKHGEWAPNKYGGNGNLEAVEFFKQLNTAVFAKFPNALMIAEESTSWANVTKPVYLDGLGFNYKWNMGWMNDTLSFISSSPYSRKNDHNKLTFSMTYAFSENFVVPISHDEVVYGKRSLLAKMPGTYIDQFANYRLYLMWMYAHPGKKLLFMGTELATFDEWDSSKQLFWEALSYQKHQEAFSFVEALNTIYKKSACLWQIDDNWDGFKWVVVNDYDNNVFAFNRMDKSGNIMLCIFNFSDYDINDYKLEAISGSYEQVLFSDRDTFTQTKKRFKAKKPTKSNTQTLSLDIKALSAMYLYKRQTKKS